MKKIILLFLVLSACKTQKLSTYNNLPLIKASHETIDYKIDDDWFIGQWNIAPQVENDTLVVVCYAPAMNFTFKTNIDSITFEIKNGYSERFYVQLNDTSYAHTIIQGIPFQTLNLDFSNTEMGINMLYQNEDNEYLSKLKSKYPTNIPKTAASDKEKILHLLNWTNARWKHNGNNSPKKNDAISILEEASEGASFPCFAYAIVLRDQLNALGYKARTIYLKTKDAKYAKYPPGHVATEVYLADIEKWVFLDGQFNIMPTLNGIPLNAVELQDAITNNLSELEFSSLGNIVSKNQYIDFIYNYLFYFDTSLDNRYDQPRPHTIDGKSSIMLVPNGYENLTRIDFWNMDITDCIYTNSINDFYNKPR